MLALCDYQLDRNDNALEHIRTAKRLGVTSDQVQQINASRAHAMRTGAAFVSMGTHPREVACSLPFSVRRTIRKDAYGWGGPAWHADGGRSAWRTIERGSQGATWQKF